MSFQVTDFITGTLSVAISYLKYCQLAYFSGPACERFIYRFITKTQPTSILEIGLGLGVRTLRMLDVATRYKAGQPIKYTGIDLFESRLASSASLSLKDAYKLLKRDGVQIKLVPGDALAAMTVTANAAANTDLIIIDSDVDDCDLENAWQFFPRMMHEQTLVLRQRLNDGVGKKIERLPRSQIESLAKAHDQRHAA